MTTWGCIAETGAQRSGTVDGKGPYWYAPEVERWGRMFGEEGLPYWVVVVPSGWCGRAAEEGAQ